MFKASKVQQLLLTLMLLVGLMTPQVVAQNTACDQQHWPIYAGGAKGSEDVRCFVYDPIEQLIIVGGVTTSEDFAPAPNDHGYMFALDLSGNWMWGSFFYNVSYAVSQIDGCQLSSDGKSLAVSGIGNQQPLLMDISTKDGNFNKFFSVDWLDASDESVPTYTNFGAIYYDKVDYRNGLPYFYGAFLQDDTMFYLRIEENKNSELRIDWNYKFIDYTAVEVASDPTLNLKEPSFIMQDPKMPSALYLIGRYRGKGSVLRFNKRDASVRWHAQFDSMSRISSVSQAAKDDDLFVCGEAITDEENYTEPYGSDVEIKATIARMKDDGKVSWIISATGKHPLYDGTNYKDQDRCMAISYNKPNEEVVVVIQGKMTEVRDSSKGDYYDTILVRLSDGGDVENVVVISQGSIGYDMYPAKNGVFWINDDIYMAGKSYGFQTQLQTLEKDADSLDYDAYIYKYRFGVDWWNECLQITEANKRTFERRVTFTSGAAAEDDGLYSFTTTYRSVPTAREDNYFVPYTSRYSGGFALLDTMKIPRPCAYQSQNLTSVQYYRGQNEYKYAIYQENSATVTAYMDGNPYIIFQNGTDAGKLAKYNGEGSTIDIQTDEDQQVGIQKTIIRSCNNLDRLLEMNLYIEVVSNTYPDFVTEPQTAFTVEVNDVFQYKLPAVSDPEGNDEPEVYVGFMEQQQEKYPEFLLYNNNTQTITLKPDSKNYAGETFYFTIVVKEKNSDSVKYSFYATVRVPFLKDGEGNEIKPEVAYDVVPIIDGQSNVTTINYTITDLNDTGEGIIKFTSPINMQWLEDFDEESDQYPALADCPPTQEQRWRQFFHIYWRDTTYRKSRENRDTASFEITEFNEDGMTLRFKVSWHDPYKLGLLVKKSDKLIIDLGMQDKCAAKYQQNGALFLGTPDTYKLGFEKNATVSIRIPMQFDFTNSVMKTFRDTAKNMYWVLIVIILVQFVALTVRGVGLLPVWIFIEYLQLVAFMPIYNFRLIPYLYDAFKPSLVAHMIIFDDTPFIDDLDEDYFNINYENYWLSVGKLFQAFFFVCVLLLCVIMANIVVFVIHKMNCSNQALNNWASKKMVQFKFNAYIRFYMLVYFDTTFFSVMKIMDEKNETVARKAALLLSYILFVVNIVLPVFLIAHINRRFDILAMKEAKQSFNSLLLKIDKASRWRIMNPAYFFGRRLLTAMLLTLPIENTFIFLQYVFILMSSHAYILYMVAVKPFQTPGINSYVLASETFYSALIIAIFIFSDATPEMSIKFGAGVALITSLILLVASNLAMNIFYMWQGPAKIKKTIKESTLKRAEKEALERAEEEERKLKKKKEEEEFTKIPDETMNMSSMDASNTTQQNNTMSELAGSRKNKKNKKKGMDDVVNEAGVDSGKDDFMPTKKKRRHGKDKDKNKQDDLVDGTIEGSAGGPTKSKKRKKKTVDTDQGVTTTNQQTDFGTTNPTQKDLL